MEAEAERSRGETERWKKEDEWRKGLLDKFQKRGGMSGYGVGPDGKARRVERAKPSKLEEAEYKDILRRLNPDVAQLKPSEEEARALLERKRQLESRYSGAQGPLAGRFRVQEAPQGSDLYTWTDESGTVHATDDPRKAVGMEGLRRLRPGGLGLEEAPEIPQEHLDAYSRMNPQDRQRYERGLAKLNPGAVAKPKPKSTGGGTGFNMEDFESDEAFRKAREREAARKKADREKVEAKKNRIAVGKAIRRKREDFNAERREPEAKGILERIKSYYKTVSRMKFDQVMEELGIDRLSKTYKKLAREYGVLGGIGSGGLGIVPRAYRLRRYNLN